MSEDLRKVLEHALRFAKGALPTHQSRGGEADRQVLVASLTRILAK